MVDAVRRYLFGRSRQRYVSRTFIAGSPQEVWAVFEAQTITFDGWVPIRVDSFPRNDGSRLVDNTITIGDQKLHMTYRIIEWKKGEGALLEIIENGTDPNLYHGEDYYMAIGVEPANGGCVLTLSHELTHNSFGGRFALAAGAKAGGRRIKRYVETRNGSASKPKPQGDWDSLRSGLITGVLTFVSFAILFDWSFAALLLGVVFVHELGHIIAMRWCGMPVRGIYFLPFLGAVAVSKSGWRSEAERGFVALMGPGFSVLPTAFLLYLYGTNESQTIYYLILISAFLNAFNLVPILPLDGGHVFGALTSRFDHDVRLVIESVFLMIGISAAAYFKAWILVGIAAMYFLLIWSAGPRKLDKPVNLHDGIWLFFAYVSTIAFYVSVAITLKS